MKNTNKLTSSTDCKQPLTAYIYFIKNNNTLKRYIGSTINLPRRIRQHLCKSRYDDYWHKDLHEHPENWIFGVLKQIHANTYEELNEKLAADEIHYYTHFKYTTGVYNLREPSINVQRGTKFSEDRVQSHRECHYGRPHISTPDRHTIDKFIADIKNVGSNI